MKSSHRIVYNTGVLYTKLLIVLVIGLVSVRLVLSALGETDYGIYSLVAGVVGMLAIMQSAMSSASMRFMAHSLGSNDETLIAKTFNTTLFLHFIIGLIVVVLIEVGGFLMFKYLLDIPQAKVYDAKIVFHFMVITTFVTIIAVPYDAVINSHENLLALSLVDILGAVLKLGVAIYLSYSSLNLLILYGFSMLVIQIIKRIIKQLYSVKHYKECKLNFRKYIDKSLAKTILSFSGWNLFGSIAAISVTQTRGILLNMFFGVHLNAANGVAKQVSSQVNTVSSSMTRALNPQLVKSEGGGDRKRMLRLTELATKYSVLLFSLFAITVIIEMPTLLNLWLKKVPEYTILFSRLILIGLMIDKFSFEITSAIRASGKIKKFTLINSSIIVLNIPISYALFFFGLPPYVIFIVSIVITIIIFYVRLILAKKLVHINIGGFIKNAVLPILIPVALSFAFAFFPQLILKENLLRVFLTFIVSVFILTLSFRYIGLSALEYKKLRNIFHEGFKKITRKR